ncbi:hypothetical protein [Candidatus Viadribacter manganicus]|uniref:AttH domain-containing protein n=1 Tax=Candidatus Viadribacter manganicus TaxID=1759059 RepID=A0A1B1AM09_9PROT|nr:hypothetical protein [Candidatus Viadribacter manganicus]ANP47607.1 hypothetical protein ATE48_17735 [Candidatus Viadribacter manganicus]
MLSWGDDYPIHQTPEPVAFSGSDRNFYDRYFFNGYSADGSVFFAAALGVYPHLGVIDAAFCLTIDGKQHNVRASRRLEGERMNLSVGPIEIDVIEPLRKLAVRVSDNDGGVRANLIFEARHAPIEEPRFTRRIGTRMFMDYTRMTQNGGWSGDLSLNGQCIDIAGARGTRDRSWGIRPVGAPDSQPAPASPQFFWLWAPFNFDDHAVFCHTNDDDAGKAWNRRAVIDHIGRSRTEFESPHFELNYVPRTRRLQRANITLSNDAALSIEPAGPKFYMSGLGYTHPTWGHGRDHGDLETAYDAIDLATIDDAAPGQLHIQALARATLHTASGEHRGHGVLEQFLIGPHAPSGFKSMLDGAA